MDYGIMNVCSIEGGADGREKEPEGAKMVFGSGFKVLLFLSGMQGAGFGSLGSWIPTTHNYVE